MPVLNGLEAAKEVKNSGSTALIIVLTVNTDPEIIAACLAAGAAAHVPKHRMFHELVPAIYEAVIANHHLPRLMEKSERYLIARAYFSDYRV